MADGNPPAAHVSTASILYIRTCWINDRQPDGVKAKSGPFGFFESRMAIRDLAVEATSTHPPPLSPLWLAFRHNADLDADSAVVAAVAGLTPRHVADVHDFASSSSSACEAAHGSASRTSVSQQSARVLTSSRLSTNCP